MTRSACCGTAPLPGRCTAGLRSAAAGTCPAVRPGTGGGSRDSVCPCSLRAGGRTPAAAAVFPSVRSSAGRCCAARTRSAGASGGAKVFASGSIGCSGASAARRAFCTAARPFPGIFPETSRPDEGFSIVAGCGSAAAFRRPASSRRIVICRSSICTRRVSVRPACSMAEASCSARKRRSI